MLATSITTTVAIIIAIALVGGWLLYGIASMRAGRKEAGAEIELAANRKPYYDDDTLEGPKLERTQLISVALLIVITLGLPLYWLLEPGRQRGAIDGWASRFERNGSRLFDTTANGGFNCAGCHGGLKATGGSAPYSLLDPTTGEVRAVTWTAPALNTVLYRFSADELRYIITYGRPFSPMSAWGLDGGGPLNDQQIDWLVAYIRSIQIPAQGCRAGSTDNRDAFDIRTGSAAANPAVCDGGTVGLDVQGDIQAKAEREVSEGKYRSVGEALFNSDLASGAYSCARCHTRGWSYGDPKVSGGGAMGPNLTGGSNVRQCVTKDELVGLLETGTRTGIRYCENGQGSGRMPGFGGELSTEQIEAIAEYVRSL
jgi:mono/diheme cytochrome c family protein